MIEKTLYIIRHGQTDLNKQGIIQGSGIDADLNARGRTQGAAFYEMYKDVPFDKVYVSKLKRTYQTVQKFIEEANVPYEKLGGLNELAWGKYEGKSSTPETKAAFLKIMRDWLDGNLDSKFYGGESPNELQAKQKQALEVIMSHPEEKTVLICMHGRALRLFLCLLTGVSLTNMDQFPHQNVILYKVTWDGSKFEIVGFNNADHLKKPGTRPVKKIRISAVSYTNTKPFLYGIERSPKLLEQIELSIDAPSDCAQKLIDDVVDIGLIPVAAVLNIPNYEVLTDYCIGAVGAVNSVFIFSNCKIEDVKNLQMDPQSRSSNNLSKVLLKNFWKIQPEFIVGAEDYSQSKDTTTAFVQIGDRTFGKADKYPFVYDLAEEWKKFTGLPFMFAGWIANKPIPAEFVAELNAALKLGLDKRAELIKTLPVYQDFDVEDYLMDKLDFDLTPEKKEAMQLFLSYIKKL